MTERCTECLGRICVALNVGRLINDNKPGEKIDTSKIQVTDIDIDNCEFKTDDSDDDSLLLGS